jgi:hypothetical protein
MQSHYEQQAHLSSDSQAALGRMRTRLEQTRYAADPQPGTTDSQDMATDVDVIVESVRSSASWARRLKAALLPSSGRAAVRQWLRRAGSGSGTDQSR